MRQATLRALLLLLAVALATPMLAAPAAAPVAVVPRTIAAVNPASLLPNGRQPLSGVLTGGQPSSEQLSAIAAAGYRTVINLRPREEGPATEADAVHELGLRYVELPVAGAQDLTPEKAAALGKLLADDAGYPLVLHCASGNRAGALLALEQAQVEGLEPDKALAVGIAAGLTHLEPRVRELLELPPS